MVLDTRGIPGLNAPDSLADTRDSCTAHRTHTHNMVLAIGLSAFASVVARAKRYAHRRQHRDAGAKASDDLRSTGGSSFCCVTPHGSDLRSHGGINSDASTMLDSPLSSPSSDALSPMASPLPHNLRLAGWMYWARYEPVAATDATRCASPGKHQTVLKVYAVLRNEFLLLYRDDHKTSRHNALPLIQIAVDRAGRSIDGAFHVFDPHNEEMELHLYDRSDVASAQRWAVALEQAAALTQAYFASVDIKRVEDLARSSMYRGTLHDFRAQQRPSFRQSAHERVRASLAPLKSLKALRPSSSTSRVFASRARVC